MDNSQVLQSPEERLLLQRAQQIAAELKARKAVKDNFFWLTEATRTVDEQSETPFKPFPKWQCIKSLLEVLDNEPVILIEKSRSVLGSWTVAGWCAHYGFTHPAKKILFQSKDEKRSLDLIHYVKTLWEQSIPQLQSRWAVKRAPRDQANSEFSLANGTTFLGVVGDPDKVRSEHPSVYVADEASIMDYFDEAWTTAAGSRVPKMIALSTVKEGAFYDLCNEDSEWADWPDYERSAA
jgi:hypothetical protein